MKYPETDKEIACFWGVPVRTVYRWKSDGAPVQSYDEMLAWLSTRKNLPRAVLEKIKLPTQPDVSSSPVSGDSGAAAALRRLESTELQAFARLQKALADGNPLMVRECRESWLKISESLRRFDLLVEQSRRDAGELVPIGEMQKFFRHFIASMQIAFTLGAERITNEICGKTEIKIYKHIRGLGNQALFMAALGYCHGCLDSPDQRLVEYAKKCIEAQFSHYPAESKNDLEQRILQIVKWANEDESTIYDNKKEGS